MAELICPFYELANILVDGFYVCDPEKNIACKKTFCHINGGDCYLTQVKDYAKTREEKHGEL